ncbi:hypothetical protein POSPLADRAFT_1144486 [Postia placenta MAD-698-R-SB12]|uniref:Uncharacterized protein n=1 Tax=Postia placenta MAD-698-R-SB12 TaxID=670580 RepID=A0A1X6MYJ2_9APHY|nr:hypothetical protein POSPLADRAFT_1144486 [Postia placenta MAD-698-R-SB12]OSX61435.1 hypothetical protein POSPLADRAFT_1144486 [Postia placenta MAD-698-R-SB12]
MLSFAASHLSSLLSHCGSLPLNDLLHPAVLKFSTATLTAGDMALWMGPGRKVLERVWERPTLALELCAALSDLGWGGWKSLALPHVLKHTPALLQSHARETAELLAALQRERRLASVDIVWKQRVQAWVDSRFARWEHAAESVLLLRDVLALSPLLASLAPLCVRIVESALERADGREEYEETCANTAWVLGACLGCLADRPSAEWAENVDVARWTQKVVQNWSCSAIVDVLKRCLQAEEVSLDVQGVRERVLRISRLPVVIQDDDEVTQLKVNLRPLWSPAAAALSLMSERFGDLVWRLLFQELQGSATGEGLYSPPSWITNASDVDGDDVWEEERTWRDPSAHKLRSAISRWLGHHSTQHSIIQDQNTGDRFDPNTYEAQLLSTLGECSSLAEKHSRDLVPFFLSLAGPDATSKLPRHKLSSWLTLFSKFVNPKALRSTETMKSLYVSLLSHADRPLQRLALSCLLTYKSPHLSPHEDMLRSLLDDTTWRDDLTQLDIAEMEQTDRAELVDVIIRLLFGLMLEKRGRSRGADRRAAVLSAFGGCTDEELRLLIDLMLRPILSDAVLDAEEPFTIHEVSNSVSEKQQIGFLTLLGDVLKHLGSRLTTQWSSLLQTLFDLVGSAQTRIDLRRQEGTKEGDDEDDESDIDDEPEGSSRATRSIRQLGLKRFTDFFRCPITFDFTRYMAEAYRAFISPRLPSLDLENTQAPSALLELFYVWTTRGEYARFLVDYDDHTLPKIYDCLVATNVKPAVVAKVFDIVDRILSLSDDDVAMRDVLLKPHVSHLLTNITTLVERTKGNIAFADTLGRRQITILSQIAPYLTDGVQASMLLDLFSAPLRKPAKVVPEKLKTDIATIMCSLFPLVPDLSNPASQIYDRTLSLLAFLFQSLRSRQARTSLVAAMQRLAQLDPSISYLADLLEALNAYSTKRIDEPDFDRRLSAFASLNDTLHSSFSPRHWIPILRNMLNFIQDPTELTVRNNASLTMKRFIDRVAGSDDLEYEAVFVKLLYPGLKNGLRSKNEMVRAEIMAVISYAVSTCDRIKSLQEMRVLLAGGDDEANFFNNVLHVQLHRRTRAIRRLAERCDEGHLRSSTLAEVFVPLIGNFIVSSSSVDHLLVNEAINATGRMARQLNWGAYLALTQQYLRLSRNKDASEKIYVRVLVAILDNFHFPMEDVIEEPEAPQDADDVDVQEEQPIIEGEALIPSTPAVQVVSVQQTARIADAVNQRLLPRLLHHLEDRNETEDSLRIPIAVGVIQVARHLPQITRETQITRLLTVLCQVLRSKSQETRDLAKETVCRIAIILGPSYLPLILRELRAALLRGPHLHVLAFVAHALLVHVTTGDNAVLFKTLDDCVNDVAHVSAEVIFGESGKDVQSEDFKTKMREVRSSATKALDSFSIMAKFITPCKISNLLLPIRNILKETESLKVLQQVDDILRRIAGGLNANEHLVPKELLVLCHTLISQNAKFLKEAPQVRRKGGKVRDDAIVQTKRKVERDLDHYANNSFRFVAFGIDLFITAHRRNRFDFNDPEVITRLESMVATIGNTLYSDRMQVVIPGMRAAAAILKCPLKAAGKSIPVFIRQIIDVVKQAGSTESEVVQTAFKSLATILREQPGAQIKEKDLIYLLELLSPDLEEPTRQASVFTMLRAIVTRKLVVPEIYDLMDKVSKIMVTSQSPQVQELCRGVLLQFLLDYPQGKGRLRNHMTLLAKNLSYVYESGRKSVMELLGAIIAKFQVDLVREYSDLLFVALVMVIANDDSPKCCEMAAELIKSLFARLADAQRNIIMSHVHLWAIQQAQPQLARVSLQVCGIIVDLMGKDVGPYVSSILEDLNGALEYSAQILESDAIEVEKDLAEQDVEWQISYHALLVFAKLLRVIPDLTVQQDKVDWPVVVEHLVYPHAWTRTASCRILGLLFAATPVAAPNPKLPDNSPFSRVGMEDVTKKLCLQLRSPNLDAALSLQIVKNLFYIGKCFCTLDAPLHKQELSGSEEEEADREDESEAEGDAEQYPLAWLLSKLSYQARHALVARRNKPSSPENWIHQPTSVLKWFAAMVSHMDASQTEHFLMHILSPVYRITEDDTIRDPQFGELKTLAVELQDLVQNKVGTTKFADVYNRIRQTVLGVRRERRNVRAVRATTNPEASMKRKLQHNAVKKESRKRKNQAFAYVFSA